MSHYLEQLFERSGWDGILFSARRHNLHHTGPQTDEKSLDMLVKIQRWLPQTQLEIQAVLVIKGIILNRTT